MNTIVIFICRYKLIEAASNVFILELGNFDKYGGIYLITKCCIEYTSPRTGFGPTTLVVISTDCTGSCKSNYHTITTALLGCKSLYWYTLYLSWCCTSLLSVYQALLALVVVLLPFQMCLVWHRYPVVSTLPSLLYIFSGQNSQWDPEKKKHLTKGYILITGKVHVDHETFSLKIC